MKNVSDEELLKKYLLGDVTQSERDEIEDRLFLDPIFFDQLLIIENELTQDYVLDKLTYKQRKQFQEYFALAPERQRRVRVAEQLKEYTLVRQGETPTAPRSRGGGFYWARMFLSFRFGISILMIFLATMLLWLLRDRQLLKNQIGELRAQLPDQREQQEIMLRALQQLSEQRAENQVLVNKIEQGERQTRQLEARINLLEKNRTGPNSVIAGQRKDRPLLIATAKPEVLWPDQRRSEGRSNVIRIAPNASYVLLQLNIGEKRFRTYRVELSDADDQKIWSEEGFKARQTADGRALVVKVPVKGLTTGDYIIRVQSMVGSRFVRVETYQFKVE